MILGVIENNLNASKEEDKIYLEIDQEIDEEFPELPNLTPKKKPKKSKGFLGYILGGLSILAGGLLMLFSGGLLASFGAGMIVNGIDLIIKNYQMNKTGTYSDEAIFEDFIMKTLGSFAGALVANNIFSNDMVNSALTKFCSFFADSQMTRDIVIQTVRNQIQGSTTGNY